MKRVEIKPTPEIYQARIESLERAQLRCMRELALDPANAQARTRLKEIDNAIEHVRLNSRR